MKNLKKGLRLQVINALLINETLDIVIKDYPEIVARAIIQTIEKNPHLFKIECPVCKSELRKTENEPDYWMCDKCIKGFNIEEIEKLKEIGKDASLHEEDNQPDGL